MVVLAASVVLVVVVVVVVLGALYTGRGVVVVGFGLFGLITTLLAVAEYEFCDPDWKESAS